MADYPLIHDGAYGLAHRAGAIGLAVLLVGLAVGCSPVSGAALSARPGFMPAFETLSLMVDGLTATLLIGQAWLARSRSTLRLGTAYVFSALIAAPQMLADPGVLAAGPLFGAGGSAAWLWCVCRGGFALCVIRYVLGGDGPLRPNDIVRAVIQTGSVVIGLSALALVAPPWLPTLLESSGFGWLAEGALGPATLAMTAAATALVIARLRCRTLVGLWLSVALLATTLDVMLTLQGGARFSIGWYAARIESLATGICVLFAMLSGLLREAGRVADVNAKLERLVRTDVLTGLANRRAFELALMMEWRRAQREQTPLSLLMIDIDFFKGFNDRYGHPAGDACLRSVGNALADQALRPADVAARVGGEEFALILPTTEENGAAQVAERLRARVASLLLPHAGNAMGVVTVSVGTATVRPYGPSGDVSQVVRDADHALYQAKAAGRNNVRSAGPAARLAASV